jgi:putative hydrolase of the HAD superfamily
MVLESTGAVMKLVPDELLKSLNRDFLIESPKNTILCQGAKEILEYLNTKYKVHILSNGFQDTQITKIKSAGIDHLIDQVVTSERAGSKKPLVGIFNYAMKHAKSLPEESIMIGDNLKTDIAGAIKFGMDHVFFNPTRERPPIEVMHEITSLLQLKKIL